MNFVNGLIEPYTSSTLILLLVCLYESFKSSRIELIRPPGPDATTGVSHTRGLAEAMPALRHTFRCGDWVVWARPKWTRPGGRRGGRTSIKA